MGVAVVGNALVFFRGNNNTDAFRFMVSVKGGHLGIVIAQSYGNCLATLGLKTCVFTRTALPLRT